MLVRLPTAAWKELPKTLPALCQNGRARLLLAGGCSGKVPHVPSTARRDARAGRKWLQVLTVGPVLAMLDRVLMLGVPKMRVRSLLCLQLALREMPEGRVQ